MITTPANNAHWIFFTAIERDAETLLRFIEPVESNFATFSMEVCRVLFAAAAEFEIVIKGICAARGKNPDKLNIHQIRRCLMSSIPEIVDERVYIGRYGLVFDPLVNWRFGNVPEWWTAYNAVKHDRAQSFSDANLKNALNAVAGLLVATVFYYRHQFAPGQPNQPMQEFDDTVLQLSPHPCLFSFDVNKHLKIYLRG